VSVTSVSVPKARSAVGSGAATVKSARAGAELPLASEPWKLNESGPV
jgi:hypothetical protein